MALEGGPISLETIKLNVGCHDIQLNGFINLDLNPAMNPDRVLDCTKLPEHYSNVDFIYCGHFLEHFPIEKSKQIVRDFHTILRPYGVCVTVVPDYMKVPINVDEAERIILGAGEHLAIYNTTRLLQVFRGAGFFAQIADVKDLPWCRFQNVDWQSAVIAIKHEPVTFK